MSRIVLALCVCAGVVAAGAALRAGLPAVSAEAAVERQQKAPRLAPLWAAPHFALIDQAGRSVTSASLSGRVWIANFVFTRCTSVCPLLTARMVRLQRRLRGTDVRFLSFSVDPANDSPLVLAAYARAWAPEEPRWSLLSTDEQSLARLARGFHVTARRADGGVDPIIHSAVMLLVDGQGMVRGSFDGEAPWGLLALEQGARTLVGAKPDDARPAAGDPQTLYHQLLCANCHEDPSLAPPIDGLAGGRRGLDDGTEVTADAAYVRESLLAPDSKRVTGYPLHMPSYAGEVTSESLEQLVEWIMARPAAGPLVEELPLELDPECGMKVRVTAQTPRSEEGGRLTYFCSDACRARHLR